MYIAVQELVDLLKAAPDVLQGVLVSVDRMPVGQMRLPL